MGIQHLRFCITALLVGLYGLLMAVELNVIRVRVGISLFLSCKIEVLPEAKQTNWIVIKTRSQIRKLSNKPKLTMMSETLM